MRYNVLGVSIDDVTLKEVVARIYTMLRSEKPHAILYANPEVLVRAARDETFRRLMQNGDLIFPDGVGLRLFGRFAGAHFRERIAGEDLIYQICENAARDGTPVFLFGGKRGVAKQAENTLMAKYPGLRIAGTRDGFKDMENWHTDTALSDAKLILVGLGSPLQETWICEQAMKLKNVRAAIAVGGALDTLSGSKARAPHILRRVGLEWVWRIAQEPERWKRIWNAVAVFPALLLFISKKDKGR